MRFFLKKNIVKVLVTSDNVRMKKIFVLLISAILFLFSSCETLEEVQNALQGTKSDNNAVIYFEFQPKDSCEKLQTLSDNLRKLGYVPRLEENNVEQGIFMIVMLHVSENEKHGKTAERLLKSINRDMKKHPEIEGDTRAVKYTPKNIERYLVRQAVYTSRIYDDEKNANNNNPNSWVWSINRKPNVKQLEKDKARMTEGGFKCRVLELVSEDKSVTWIRGEKMEPERKYVLRIYVEDNPQYKSVLALEQAVKEYEEKNGLEYRWEKAASEVK